MEAAVGLLLGSAGVVVRVATGEFVDRLVAILAVDGDGQGRCPQVVRLVFLVLQDVRDLVTALALDAATCELGEVGRVVTQQGLGNRVKRTLGGLEHGSFDLVRLHALPHLPDRHRPTYGQDLHGLRVITLVVVRARDAQDARGIRRHGGVDEEVVVKRGLFQGARYRLPLTSRHLGFHRPVHVHTAP